MAPKFGHQGQFGWGAESTYGVAGTVNKFSNGFLSESLKLDVQRIFVPSIRGTRSRSKLQVVPGQRMVAGDVAFAFYANGLGKWIEHALGQVSSAQQGGSAAYLHTFSLAEALPTGLTLEADREAQFHKYTGCLIDQLTFEAKIGEPVRMTARVLGKDEAVSGSGATATYPSTDEVLYFTQGVFQIGGAGVDIREFRVTLNNMLFGDDYRIGSASRFSSPPRGREVSGQFMLPYEAVTEYSKFRDFTVAALNLTFTGTLIAATYYNKLELNLPVVFYDGETPNLGGAEEEIKLSIPFRAWKDTLPEFDAKLTNRDVSI